MDSEGNWIYREIHIAHDEVNLFCDLQNLNKQIGMCIIPWGCAYEVELCPYYIYVNLG